MLPMCEMLIAARHLALDQCLIVRQGHCPALTLPRSHKRPVLCRSPLDCSATGYERPETGDWCFVLGCMAYYQYPSNCARQYCWIPLSWMFFKLSVVARRPYEKVLVARWCREIRVEHAIMPPPRAYNKLGLHHIFSYLPCNSSSTEPEFCKQVEKWLLKPRAMLQLQEHKTHPTMPRLP